MDELPDPVQVYMEGEWMSYRIRFRFIGDVLFKFQLKEVCFN